MGNRLKIYVKNKIQLWVNIDGSYKKWMSLEKSNIFDIIYNNYKMTVTRKVRGK
jgi:hypothetical protein